MGYEGFNSDNSKILATYDEVQSDGITNTHMLLMREYESGRVEFVIGSYFTESKSRFCCPRCGSELSDSDVPGYRFLCTECDENFYTFEAKASAVTDYSWDWGHYFNSVLSAVDYWERDVLLFKPADEIDVEFPKNDNGWATCPRCGEDVYDTDRFCSHCGVKINSITE